MWSISPTSEQIDSLWQRANARNASTRISLQWPIYLKLLTLLVNQTFILAAMLEYLCNQNKPKQHQSPSVKLQKQIARLASKYFLSQGSRYGAVVRALVSHQCGLSSIPGVDAVCGLSLLVVFVPASRIFLWVLPFSSLRKNQHSKFQFDLETVDERATLWMPVKFPFIFIIMNNFFY